MPPNPYAPPCESGLTPTARASVGRTVLAILRVIALFAAAGAVAAINATIPLSAGQHCTTTHADLPDLLAIACLVWLVPLAGVLTWLGRVWHVAINALALLPVLGSGIWATGAAFSAEVMEACQPSALEGIAQLVYLLANIAFAVTVAYRSFQHLEARREASQPAR